MTIPRVPCVSAEFWPRYITLLSAAMPRSTRSHQLAIVASLRVVTGRLWLLSAPSADADQTALTEAANQLGTVLALALETPKYPSLRREALAVTQAVLGCVEELRDGRGFPVLPAAGALSVRLTPALETAAADPSHDIRDDAAAAARRLAQLGQ